MKKMKILLQCSFFMFFLLGFALQSQAQMQDDKIYKIVDANNPDVVTYEMKFMLAEHKGMMAEDPALHTIFKDRWETHPNVQQFDIDPQNMTVSLVMVGKHTEEQVLKLLDYLNSNVTQVVLQ